MFFKITTGTMRMLWDHCACLLMQVREFIIPHPHPIHTDTHTLSPHIARYTAGLL